jgi:ABC-type Fe3+ transport system permease subunit/sugar lactone lactonase YvrE
MSGVLLINSLTLAVMTAVATIVVGWAAAVGAMGAGRRTRYALVAMAILALAMPPFLATNVWLRWFGITGAGSVWITSNLLAMSGAVLLLTLLFWPVAFLLALGAWSRLEPEELEVEPQARGWRMMRWLLWPRAMPALRLTLIVVFVLALNQFAVPALLQVRVYPAEVWIQFNTHLDPWGALLMGWPMLAAPLGLILALACWQPEMPWPAIQGQVRPAVFRRCCGRRWFIGCACLTAGVILLSVAVPLQDLLGDRRTWAELGAAVRAGRGAIVNSLVLSATSATVVLVGGLASWRWRGGYWLWTTFLVPGIVLGVMLIVAFNRPPFLEFYRGAGMVVFALVLRYAAVGWAGARYAMRSLDPGLEDAARVDGASGYGLWWQVRLPQVAPKAGVVWMIVYLLCLWDVETLLLIAPPGTESLAGRVFGLLHYGHNAQVNALCLVLLGLAVLPLGGWLMARFARRLGRWRKGVALSCCGVAPVMLLLSGCGSSSSGELALDSAIFDRVEVIGSRGTGLGQFNKPRSVAVDKEDNLYVVDITGRVQKFTPEGQYQAYWRFPVTDMGQPKGMACDEAGNIVVLEPHYARVNHFTPSGQLIGQWGERGTIAGRLSFPRAVVVCGDGDLLVSEYGPVERVQRFRAETWEVEWVIDGATPGALPFNRPEGLGLDEQERIYVADSCNHRIQIYDREGRFLRAHGRAGEGVGEFSYPYDIRIDAMGRQYVCEFGNSRIQILDREDRPLEILGGPGSAPGQLNNPWSLALDSRGNLYVADTLNHRVQKWVVRRGARQG